MITIKIMMGMSFLAVGLLCQAADVSLLARYGECYEKEVSGDPVGAITGYGALLPEARTQDPALYARLLYRTGWCERRLGRPESARLAWRDLAESCPADEPLVVSARESLKLLEREFDRMVVAGFVTGPAPGTNAVPAFVFVGEWGSEPPVVAGSNGVFRATRKAAGRLPDGRRYGFIYAEHPTLPWVAAGIFAAEGTTTVASIALRLGPAVALSGHVRDASGRLVDGALMHVIGFKDDTPIPFDRIIPPVLSKDGGQFTVSGLVPGLRYIVMAEKPGYQHKTATETEVPAAVGSGMVIPAGDVVLSPEGEVSLRGRVVNERGEGVRAKLSVWSPPPISRQVAWATAGADGHFVLRGIRENWVVLKVDAGDDFLPRSISGLKPMGQDVDVVVRFPGGGKTALAQDSVTKGSGVAPVPVVTTQQLAAAFAALRWLRGNPDTGGPLRLDDLKGHVVVYHFESTYRATSLHSQYPGEPAALARLMSLYGDRDVDCVWILPADEGGGEAARSALALYPDLPVAALGAGPDPVWTRVFEQGGNVIVDPAGRVHAVCSDPQVFKAVKRVVGEWL